VAIEGVAFAVRIGGQLHWHIVVLLENGFNSAGHDVVESDSPE